MALHRAMLRMLPAAGLLVGSLIAPAVTAPGAMLSVAISAQAPAAPGPVFTSPEVQSDRRITFRVLAPDAQKVELRSPGDIPGVSGRGVAPPQLTKSAEGVWEATFGPVPAGAYRYVFVVERRHGSRLEESDDQPDEHDGLQSGGRARLGAVRHEERPPRRGRLGPLPFDGARRHPPDARLHAAGIREAIVIVIRCCTCCTALATSTIRGHRSAAPDSSSTT